MIRSPLKPRMKSDSPLPPNHRTQALIEAILILLGVAFFAYILYSPGSTSPSRPLITQTLQPTLLNTASQSALTTSEQLVIFEKIWQYVNDNYLYQDFNGLDWNAIHTEYKGKIEAGLREDVFYLEMEELINKLGNKHTQFLPPNKNLFTAASPGIIWISIQGENSADVVLVFPNSSAGQAGLLPRDRLLAVDGKLIPDNIRELLSLINGNPGTKVNLMVQTPGQEPRQVQLTRGFIKEPMPVPYKAYTTSGGKKIGYLILASFYYGSLRDQITEAIITMNYLKPLDGLIVDVRANAGGWNTITLEAISYFTHGAIGYFIERNSKTLIDIPDRDILGSSHIPMVVLISPTTTSDGALFAGVLQDMGRAYLIGENTDKAVDSAEIYTFTNGSTLEVAYGAVHPMNHPDLIWTETGIAPDLEVKANWNDFWSENDPVIRAALDYFDR